MYAGVGLLQRATVGLCFGRVARNRLRARDRGESAGIKRENAAERELLPPQPPPLLLLQPRAREAGSCDSPTSRGTRERIAGDAAEAGGTQVLLQILLLRSAAHRLSPSLIS